jgi:lipopolysaccharide transport system permease protein
VAWVVLQPLLGAGVLSIVFGRVAKFSSGDVPYFLIAFAGTVWWTAASQALTRVTSSLVVNAQLISKVYFPRLVLPLGYLWSGLVDTVVASLFFLVLLLVMGPSLSLSLLLAPLWIAGGIILGAGIGLSCATLTVRYRDVQQILPVFLQLMLFASPVAYRLDDVPPSFRWVYELNPATGYLEGLRWSTVGGPLPAVAVGWSLAATCLAIVGGLLVFGRWERTFADVI